MTDTGVAFDTQLHLAARRFGQHRVHRLRMAIDATFLRDTPVALFNLNRLVKILQRKRQRMKKTIVGLGDIFSHTIAGQVAVITNGNVMVAALLPRIEMPLHDVTVGAGRRIVTEIAMSLGIPECETADSNQHAADNDDGTVDRKENAERALAAAHLC